MISKEIKRGYKNMHDEKKVAIFETVAIPKAVEYSALAILKYSWIVKVPPDSSIFFRKPIPDFGSR